MIVSGTFKFILSARSLNITRLAVPPIPRAAFTDGLPSLFFSKPRFTIPAISDFPADLKISGVGIGSILDSDDAPLGYSDGAAVNKYGSSLILF